jgi:Domain of unknown function (DUF2017)
MPRSRFPRDRSGRFRVKLPAAERELLGALPTQVADVLDPDQPLAVRLFPVAYVGDDQAQADYKSLVGSELVRSHRGALDTLGTTAGSATLTEEELHQWLRALEVLRLVVGTDLDVSEGDEGPFFVAIDDAQSARRALYAYLSELQSEVIDALSVLLPEEGIRD